MIIFSSVHDPELVGMLRYGAVGVLPADTIYGIVAGANNAESVTRLYALKHREQKPGTVIAASVEQLRQLGVADKYLDQVAHLWPNPLSVEVPLDSNLAYLHQGTGHGAFRVVADEALRTLLAQTGPLLTSSANQPGEPPAINVDEARSYFGDAVDFYVDGGDRSNRPPSTVMRLHPDGILELVRQGAVKIDEHGNIMQQDAA